MTRSHGTLRSEFDFARATTNREESVIHDYVQRVRTGYRSLICAETTSYRDLLNAMLTDAQTRGDYIDGFRVRVSENGNLFHIGDTNSDEEQEGRIPTLGANCEDLELFISQPGLRSYFYKVFSFIKITFFS